MGSMAIVVVIEPQVIWTRTMLPPEGRITTWQGLWENFFQEVQRPIPGSCGFWVTRWNLYSLFL